jgi:eukaryotic-like serine/threonine-protein kinase
MAEPHKQLGDYEIVRELGHGGMGQVYLVRNVISDRIEAMKVLLPDLAQQGELASRFMREIKVLASLEHPNIAQLRTAFTADNQLVMIMEYVEGDTLAQRLEGGAFSPADTLNYISQVLAALSYAHSKGIIHRDIKPSNMMLTPQGVVKLMDFGIARSTTDLGMTVTGTTMGSLDYMSPEQVKSELTDARSDLYSVGVSMYEMITGHRMFSATSSFSVMEAHVKEIPRAPIELQPSMPKGLNDIIMMAVAKDPAQRFQTAEAFRNALSQVAVAGTAAMAAAAPATQIPVVAAPPAFTPPPTATPAGTPTPTPAPAAYTPTPTPQLARGGRHVGWIVVAAIVVLVALFGGSQVYRNRKQNAAIDSAMPTSTTTTATPTLTLPTPEPTPPAQPTASADAAPATAPPVASPAPSGRHAASQAAPMGAEPPMNNGPSAEEIAAQKKLMDEMERDMDGLDSRAATVESSVGTLEQQMHQSGLGLRGDVVEARANLRNDLAKAKQALENMDTERARQFMDRASRELDKLESFTGRR